jgi:hypothetical protein
LQHPFALRELYRRTGEQSTYSDIPTWMISAEQLERFEQSVRKLSQRLINPSPHGLGESVRSPVVDPAEVERFERAALI